MRNLIIILTIALIGGFVVTYGLIELHEKATATECNRCTNNIDLDTIRWRSITPEEIQADDPEGATVFIEQIRSDGELLFETREAMRVWGFEIRHDIFERRFGFRYAGDDLQD